MVRRHLPPEARRRLPPEGIILCHLDELIADRGLTVEAAARLCGLSRPTIGKLRRNTAGAITFATIARLCSGLKVGTGVLFEHIPRSVARAERTRRPRR